MDAGSKKPDSPGKGADELAQAQAALQESEERFRVTFELAPVGIVFGDLRGALRLTNRRIRELFGYDQESEFINLRLWQCTHPDDLWTVERFKKLLAGEIDDYVLEKRYLRRDGSVWWASVNCYLVRDEAGRPRYFVVLVEDVSERKQAEEALKAAQEELEAKVAERTAELQAANTALQVLLNHRSDERRELEEKVKASADRLIRPLLERLQASGLTGDQRALVKMVSAGVQEITSPFTRRLSSQLVGLTPKELEVAHLVKEGKSSSEIGELLAISDYAVAFHRQNIRGKLGIKTKKINLHSYLRQLAET
ncbi:MAG: PAS domain S-box protein [Desulfarculus sp.]|jgi:PAS domain S-box-containing protein|nr:MAG: PAS domain S-box protein [Desulfarculus sp.]